MTGRAILWFWIVCLCTSILGFPYFWFSIKNRVALSPESLFALDIVVGAFISGLACYIGFKITPKTDLTPFLYTPWMKRTLLPSLIAGVLVGGGVALLDRFVLHPSLSNHPIPLWSEGIYALDKAVRGTIILRFCLFTCVYFLVCKWLSRLQRLSKLWIANLIVAFPFALFILLGSLHLEFSIHDALWKTFLFSGAPNLVFGSLYWSRGLGATIGATVIEKWVTQLFAYVLSV